MRVRTLAFWLLLALLVAPAALLTVARAVQPGGGGWIRLVSFTPLALPAYAAAVTLLLGRALLGGRRLAWLAGAALVAVPLGVHTWWYLPQLTGPNPPPADHAQPVRVFTANLWEGRVDGLDVVAAGSDAGADLLVLEEVTPAVLARMEDGGLDDAWPYRAGEPADGIAGTMVFSRFPLDDVTRLPTALGSWSLTVAAPDGALRLLAVHPMAPIRPAAWRADLAAVASAGPADLVVGDFNATADHAPMRALLRAGLHSAAERTNQAWQPTWPANGRFRVAGVLPLPPLVQIDQVLVGPSLAVLSTRTLHLPSTDHLAVLAELAAQ